MRVTVSAPEPELLHETKPGNLFLIHLPLSSECVFARLIGAQQRAQPRDGSDISVVVVGCRVDPGEPGYYDIGEVFVLNRNTSITRVEPAETVELRARSSGHTNGCAAAEPEEAGITFEQAIRNFEAEYERLLSLAGHDPAGPEPHAKGRIERAVRKFEQAYEQLLSLAFPAVPPSRL